MPGLAHMVYFTLHDESSTAIDHLVSECKKYLDGHPGTSHFSVGKLTPDLTRPVNDRSFHVALHVVFETRQAHDAYQVAPRHQQFIDDNKPTWKQVRVFDSDLA